MSGDLHRQLVNVHPGPDLSQLRIDREAPSRRRWVPWAVLVALLVVVAALYPRIRGYVAEQRSPEVEVIRATVVTASPGGSTALPVLVATGYVVARRSSDVGVKTGGRLARLAFEEGTRVRRGEVIAEIEHADVDAQLEAARRAVAEADALLAQAAAVREEDVRNLERQRTLARQGIATTAALTAADSMAAVSAARVKSAEAAISSAQARVRVAEAALENTNVRAPFDGVVIKKRAELGETVSPFGMAGQATREGGAIATIADLKELEVQTEVSENGVAKLKPGMPAEVKLQAYPDNTYKARLRQIFPSADRAKAIVEVRVSILNADVNVKPEMTASVTFQEARADPTIRGEAARSANEAVVMVPKRAVTEQGGRSLVWVVRESTASRRFVKLGSDRIDQFEIALGLAPGEAVILNPPAALTDGARVRLKRP